MPALNLIIADDHHLVRSGLCKLIAKHSDLHVAAECGTGRETLTALDAHPCKVLLLDLSLPDMSGLDVLKSAHIRHPTVAVLVVSGYPERQFGINVLRAGAKGFIGKGVDEAELLRAIRVVAHGVAMWVRNSRTCWYNFKASRATTAAIDRRHSCSSRSQETRAVSFRDSPQTPFARAARQRPPQDRHSMAIETSRCRRVPPATLGSPASSPSPTQPSRTASTR